MAGLKIDDVLGIDDRPCEAVSVPEWGGDVYLTTMTSRDFDRIEARFVMAQDNPDDAGGLTAEYVAACWCDEKGNRSPAPAAKVKALAEKSPLVLRRLFAKAQEINSGVEETEKNSNGAPADGS